MANIAPEKIKATRLAGGKRMAAISAGIARDKLYPVEQAVKMVKERAKAKFDETVEISLNLGVDPKHADQMVRGVCQLPNGSGRTARVAVFARGAKADEAKAAGAPRGGAEGQAVKGAKGGAVEFRGEKAGIVHAGVGKASFTETALVENIKAFVDAVVKARPAGAKGTYLKRVSISSTQGPGVKIDAQTVASGAVI